MNISPLSNRAQEAMETPAQTRAEAGQGDVQAKMKLAQIVKLQQQAPPAATAAAAVDSVKTAADSTAVTTPPSAPPPPTGAVLNVKR